MSIYTHPYEPRPTVSSYIYVNGSLFHMYGYSYQTVSIYAYLCVSELGESVRIFLLRSMSIFSRICPYLYICLHVAEILDFYIKLSVTIHIFRYLPISVLSSIYLTSHRSMCLYIKLPR